jgi:hypothetical protein
MSYPEFKACILNFQAFSIHFALYAEKICNKYVIDNFSFAAPMIPTDQRIVTTNSLQIMKIFIHSGGQQKGAIR